ncbi:TonB-dependent receptor domain-containing protein [Paracoccus sp. PAR01]|uniref:TonB-dependent receptor domain-containing protein n=1 Tax=Paracoccus sp. PAR01 TaxID=2769282 RepID=UPI001785BF5E|nr:TonB-dependent receptor [Paracoccus sp. PAR01]MBD9528740.1 TonB-dependent receptor [Paracoccus sp. PAR01]
MAAVRRLATLTTTVTLIAAAPAATLAQEAVRLDTVVLSSEADGDGDGTSTVLGADQIQLEYSGLDLSQVLDEIPGVTTQVSGGDPGVSVNIRGMQDFGRVNVLVDGARQNFQRTGHGANGSFYTDTEMLKSVEVTRGPGATVNGGGAIGGVVSLTTIDADDIIADGSDRGGRLRFSLDSNGPGPTVNLVGAMRPEDRVDFLLGGTYLDRRDYTSGGGDRVASGQTMNSGLFKTRFRPAEGHELSFTASRYDTSFLTGTSILRDTDVTVDTAIAGYRWTSVDSDFWDLSVKTYLTRTEADQSVQNGPFERSFRIETSGLDAHNTAHVSTGGVEHEVTFGGDVFRDRVSTVDRVGTSDELTPPGTRVVWGAYIQDRVALNPWFELEGALRFDAYELENDRHRVEGDRLSPKFLVRYIPDERISFHLSYAEAMRPPALTESMIEGFHPGSVSGEFLPNPDLRPEIAHTIEAGLDAQLQGLLRDDDEISARFAVFQNDIDDYIDQNLVQHGLFGAIQYLNIGKVRIRGAELELSYDSSRFFGGLNGQLLDGQRRGGDDLNDVLLYPQEDGVQPKVPPYQIAATAGIKALDARLQMGARATFVGEQKNARAEGYVGDSYETLDLFAQYQINDDFSANVALNNVLDRDYTQYLNANPSPGFNAHATLSVRF